MTVYIDLIFIINLAFDCLLLLLVNIILKRNKSLFKVFLGGFGGSLSIFFLFIPLNSFLLLFFKFIISALMILITFGFVNIKYFINNLINLYLTSILLGGFLYFLSISFSYKNHGLIFYYDNLSINFYLLLFLGPLVLLVYYYQQKKQKTFYHHIINGFIYFKDNKRVKVSAFIDSGNQLKDPYFNRPIVLVERQFLKNIDKTKYLIIPYQTLNNRDLLSCVPAKKIVFNNKRVYKNILVGISDELNMEGVNCIINNQIMEAIK